MPITFDETMARFEGVCAIEEAEPLQAWLADHGGSAAVDLTACEHLHTALFQLLCRYRPVVAAPPADAFLREWLLPCFASSEPLVTGSENQS